MRPSKTGISRFHFKPRLWLWVEIHEDPQFRVPTGTASEDRAQEAGGPSWVFAGLVVAGSLGIAPNAPHDATEVRAAPKGGGKWRKSRRKRNHPLPFIETDPYPHVKYTPICFVLVTGCRKTRSLLIHMVFKWCMGDLYGVITCGGRKMNHVSSASLLYGSPLRLSVRKDSKR